MILIDNFLHDDRQYHISNNVYTYKHCLKYENCILYMFVS